jgi:hypothetical protein
MPPFLPFYFRPAKIKGPKAAAHKGAACFREPNMVMFMTPIILPRQNVLLYSLKYLNTLVSNNY